MGLEVPTCDKMCREVTKAYYYAAFRVIYRHVVDVCGQTMVSTAVNLVSCGACQFSSVGDGAAHALENAARECQDVYLVA